MEPLQGNTWIGKEYSLQENAQSENVIYESKSKPGPRLHLTTSRGPNPIIEQAYLLGSSRVYNLSLCFTVFWITYSRQLKDVIFIVL